MCSGTVFEKSEKVFYGGANSPFTTHTTEKSKLPNGFGEKIKIFLSLPSTNENGKLLIVGGENFAAQAA